jgi:hypothetical protein
VFLTSPILQTVPKLDFEKEQVASRTVKDLPKKRRSMHSRASSADDARTTVRPRDRETAQPKNAHSAERGRAAGGGARQEARGRV